MSVAFFRIWRALGGLWVAVVLWLSLTPHPPQPLSFNYADKLEHTLAYGFLMSWFAVIYYAKARYVSMLALIIMGVGVEILQGLGGHRYFEYADMLANSSGVVLAGWLMTVWGDARVRRLQC